MFEFIFSFLSYLNILLLKTFSNSFSWELFTQKLIKLMEKVAQSIQKNLSKQFYDLHLAFHWNTVNAYPL